MKVFKKKWFCWTQAENNSSKDNGEIKELQEQVQILVEEKNNCNSLQVNFADIEKMFVTKRPILLESRLFYKKC